MKHSAQIISFLSAKIGLWFKAIRAAKSPQIGDVFNPHKSFPGRQPKAASRKCVEIQASSISRKTKNHFEPKICLCKGV